MRFALPLLAALALAAIPARAAGPVEAALRNEVKALEERVRLLEQRVQLLEGAAHAAPPAATTAGHASPEAALRASWGKIGQGLDAREVEALLGRPSRKLTLDGRTLWYYEYPGTGRGSVFFTDAGRVSSSQPPFGWGW